MTLRSHKYAILLTATVGVALVESFSHRLLLRPVASDLAVLITEMLVLLIVFDRPRPARFATSWQSSVAVGAG